MCDDVIDVLYFLTQDDREREQKKEALFLSRILQAFDLFSP